MGRKLTYSYGEGTETVRRVQLGLLGSSRGHEGWILANGLNWGNPVRTGDCSARTTAPK
jgi:hypothetical protein